MKEDMLSVLSHEEPFGPPSSEAFASSEAIFKSMYVSKNRPHEDAIKKNHTYIIGRRGAGKTTFLIGASMEDGSHFIRIGSSEVYSEVHRIIKDYNDQVSVLVADNSCYIWEVLFTHAALLYISRTNNHSAEFDKIWSYISTYGNPLDIEIDDFLSRVSAEIRSSVLNREAVDSFRSLCGNIIRSGIEFAEIRESLKAIVMTTDLKINVVVDNLEDINIKVILFADTLAALFRFAARSSDSKQKIETHYKCQFCFPSEVLPAINNVVANSEKDLRSRQIIEWSARELMHLVANRFSTYVSVNNLHNKLPKGVSNIDLTKSARAEEEGLRLLRAVLPKEIKNGFSTVEDPIAYLLRHTQLVPRHLIEILNRIFKYWYSENSGRIPHSRVLIGLEDAEEVSRSSVLSAYSGDFPGVRKAIQCLHNSVPLVFTSKDLQLLFTRNAVSRSGMDFTGFREALLTMGAIGIYTGSTARYHEAEFAYTIRGSLPGLADDAKVCIHPLFLKEFHDAHSIEKMRRSKQVLPIYPKGSDLDSDCREDT